MKIEKQELVLDAAEESFIRYGFRRTTMGDIAKMAEISRPAVYLVYENKKEIFRAVLIRKCEQIRQLGEQRMEGSKGLEQKLTALLTTWVLEPYEIINTSPEAQELYESTYSFATDLRERIASQFEAQLLDAITSSSELKKKALKKRDLTTESVARLIALSTLELKRAVSSAEELEEMLGTTVRVYQALLTQ